MNPVDQDPAPSPGGPRLSDAVGRLPGAAGHYDRERYLDWADLPWGRRSG